MTTLQSPPTKRGGTGIRTSETDNLVPISALEHYSYCPRQCALIHLEQSFDENIFTMRGRDVHENVDVDSSTLAAGVRYERALPLWSRSLGLTGRADLVEFHGESPYPVEYKSGRHRKGRHESLQLCAQALCLEEMLKVKVEKGALYWHASRERMEVFFDSDIRSRVEEMSVALREMMAQHRLPPPVNDKRCRDCSLQDQCMPQVVGDRGRSRKAVAELFTTHE